MTAVRETEQVQGLTRDDDAGLGTHTNETHGSLVLVGDEYLYGHMDIRHDALPPRPLESLGPRSPAAQALMATYSRASPTGSDERTSIEDLTSSGQALRPVMCSPGGR